jgi:DNA-binding response OmpR family regulator
MQTAVLLIIDPANGSASDDTVRTTSVALILAACLNAEIHAETVSDADSGAGRLQTDNRITQAVIRFEGRESPGGQICQATRKIRSADDLTLIMIVQEDRPDLISQALDCGADDVLIEPFEAREVRMRLGLQPASQRRRIDTAHLPRFTAVQADEAVKGTVAGDGVPVLIRPAVQHRTMQFGYSAGGFEIDETCVAAWNADRSVVKVRLDRALVCPECSAIPTFRYGCRHCGCGLVSRDVLIHHFACAHVGPESSFRCDDRLVCPKCRLDGLVAGTDFEHTGGAVRCADCRAVSSESVLIGHCLNCEHRFAVSDAVTVELLGYRFPSAQAHTVGDERPAVSRSRTNSDMSACSRDSLQVGMNSKRFNESVFIAH